MTYQDHSYKAPWAKTVKMVTYGCIVFLGLFSVFMVWMGLHQVRAGDASGWIAAIVVIVICVPTLTLPALWAPRGYRINEDAVVLRKLVGDERIEFDRIQSAEIRDSKEVFASSFRVIGSGGLYGTYGSFSGGILGSFRAMVTNDGPIVVLRMKRGEPLVISPENPTDFLRDLRSQSGIQTSEKPFAAEPLVAFRPPFTPAQWVMEIIAVLFLIASLAVLAYYWPHLPQTIPTHFGASGKPDNWGPKSDVLILPVAVVGLYLIMTAVEVVVSRLNKAPAALPKARRAVDLTRWGLGSMKCFLLALLAYIIWQTCLTALGKSEGMGAWLTVVVLLFFVILEPAALIIIALYALKPKED